MASRALTDLHPEVFPLATAALAECRRQGLDVLVTCTFRSAQEQDELYAQGRTRPGAVVTNAKAGQSAHNYRVGQVPASLALDVVPIRNGKPVWGLAGNGIDNDPADDARDDLELWQRVRKCFEDAGFESASRWPKFREWPHFQSKRTKELMS